jgi:hypothetical protein
VSKTILDFRRENLRFLGCSAFKNNFGAALDVSINIDTRYCYHYGSSDRGRFVALRQIRENLRCKVRKLNAPETRSCERTLLPLRFALIGGVAWTLAAALLSRSR